MGWEFRLNAVGFFVQLVGAVVTSAGFAVAWYNTDADDPFLGPLHRLIGRWRQRAYSKVRAFMGHPVEVRARAGIALGGLTVTARGIGASSPVHPGMDTDAAVAALADRVVRIHVELKRLTQKLSDESVARESGDHGILARLDDQLDQRTGEQRALAMSGLRWAVLGFLVITLGAVLLGAGSVVGSWPLG
ncbi:MAG: hypothetical protein AB7I38_18065 [Dehalococcoidia bacterium]